jgi:hypothetical protein
MDTILSTFTYAALFGLGLLAGLLVALFWYVQARQARADLRDAQARCDRAEMQRDSAYAERDRLGESLDGAVSYRPRMIFPRPLGLRYRG